jgi:hypothetical protein
MDNWLDDGFADDGFADNAAYDVTGDVARLKLPAFVDLALTTQRPSLPPFLINGLLYRGDKLLVSGPSKAGKSILLLELALAVATGGRWLGFRCKVGSVLYVNFEVRPDAFTHRFYDLKEATGGLEPEQGRLLVLNMRGVNLADGVTSFVDLLIASIAADACNFSLIIIDPFYKVAAGDENAADDVHKVLKHFDEIAAATGASVCVVHHHSKYSQGSKSPIDRAAGSGVFGRDFDCIVDLTQLDASKAIDAEIARIEPKSFRELGNEAQASARWEFRQEAEAHLTAWRVSFVARHTATPQDANAWFEYPRHRLDQTGKLAAACYYNPNEAKAIQRAEQRNNKLHDAMEALAAEGNTTPTIEEVMTAYGGTRRTVERHIDESQNYERVRPQQVGCTGTAYRVIEVDENA